MTAITGAAVVLAATLIAFQPDDPPRIVSREGDDPAREGEAPAEPHSDLATSTPATYHRHSLDEWPEIIKSLDLSGPEAAVLVPALTALTADPTVPWVTRRQAAFALGRIGEPARSAVPTLRTMLHAPLIDNEIDTPRLWSLKAIGLLGPAARDAFPDVIEVLHDPASPQLHRLAALEALARIGAAEPRTLSQLVNVLRDGPGVAASSHGEALELRVAAAELLALYGNAASATVPVLIAAARSEHEPLRRAAVTTLGGLRSDLALDSLTEALVFDDSPAVQDAAGVALSKLGRNALHRLVSLTKDSDPGVRWRAADALGRMEAAEGAAARSHLTPLLTDSDPVVQIAAAEALWSLTAEPAQVLEVALGMLSVPDRELRIRAYRLVLRIGVGPARDKVVARLNELASDEDTRVRQAALLALRELQAVRP